jgi:PKD repeat protein
MQRGGRSSAAVIYGSLIVVLALVLISIYTPSASATFGTDLDIPAVGGVVSSPLYPGEVPDIAWNLYNNQPVGSPAVTITSFVVAFDWTSPGAGQELLSSPLTIEAGRSATISGEAITIPDVAVGTHTMNETVTGMEDGESAPTTRVFIVGQVEIVKRSTLTTSMSLNVSKGVTPLSVQFDAHASGGTPTYTYSWDFGDGGTSSSATPTHAYLSPGTYDVSVVTTDKKGREVRETKTVTVGSPIHASFSSNITSGTAPLSVQFNSEISGGFTPYTYSWTFGDGGRSTEKDPVHVFSTPGTYLVNAKVTDDFGLIVTGQINITVFPTPLLTITSNVTNGTAPLSVSFSSTVVSEYPQTGLLWSFGDGTSSSQANPTHVYSIPGNYSVQLYSFDDQQKRTYSSVINITVEAPIGYVGPTHDDPATPLPSSDVVRPESISDILLNPMNLGIVIFGTMLVVAMVMLSVTSKKRVSNRSYYCENCGKTIPHGTFVCPHCGHKKEPLSVRYFKYSNE